MPSLQVLLNRLEKSAKKFHSDQGAIAAEISEIVGVDLAHTYFTDDGLGIGQFETEHDSYTPIKTLISIYKRTGKITLEDIERESIL